MRRKKGGKHSCLIKQRQSLLSGAEWEKKSSAPRLYRRQIAPSSGRSAVCVKANNQPSASLIIWAASSLTTKVTYDAARRGAFAALATNCRPMKILIDNRKNQMWERGTRSVWFVVDVPMLGRLMVCFKLERRYLVCFVDFERRDCEMPNTIWFSVLFA